MFSVLGNAAIIFYDYSYGKNILKSCKWNLVFEVINNINENIGSFTSHFQSREIDELQDSLMHEFGENQKTAIATMKRYVDVCRMSGRLDN